MRLLLDTHVWIWFVQGNSTLRKHAPFIEQVIQESQVLVSPISCWETGQLSSRGRIQLPMPCQVWVEQALDGFALAQFSPAIAVEANYLPGNFHPDPADRMLVATARLLDLVLVTRDARILGYGTHGHVKTYAV
jgi:PIN domain nuclease of toxin-antitoxin system